MSSMHANLLESRRLLIPRTSITGIHMCKRPKSGGRKGVRRISGLAEGVLESPTQSIHLEATNDGSFFTKIFCFLSRSYDNLLSSRKKKTFRIWSYTEIFLASGGERRAAKRRVDRRRELPVTVIPVNRTTS